VRREGLSRGGVSVISVGETAQVARYMDLELDTAAPRPFMRMDMPSNLLVRCNTQSFIF